MEELWSFGSVIALWIGASCALWWLHRRRVHGAQNRQLEQAARAIALIRDGQTIFDTIRTPVPIENPPEDTGEWLRAETHGLLRRIQDHGDLFDKVNTLRVQLQASAGIEDHTPLSEILNLRRDLWAASEILLVEDPKSFGTTFAEDGAYERFHAEALQLLFKGAKRTGDDLIDLRLSLAANDAESFAADLGETIEAAREKDRLPTFSEAIAYPLAFFRAIPRQLATAFDFGRAFLGHAADTARAMRESETMVRGASRLRQAQEDWPQRLSAGFERASTAARGSATALQQHYDFLVTAYDFQSKYEQVVRRAPEITERGRQFIARLELAERSERLRLTSANAAVWMARRSLDGLAHLIAGLQRWQAALSETALWRLAGRLLAPAPLTGRRTSSFRSYRRALAIAGLNEPAQQIARPAAPKKQASQKTAASARKAAKGAAAPRAAAKSKTTPKKIAAAKTVPPARQSRRSAAKSAPTSPPAKNVAAAVPPPAQPKPARPFFGGILAKLTKPRTEKPSATSRAAEATVSKRKATAKSAPASPPETPAQAETVRPSIAETSPPPATGAEAAAKPSRRLFSWRKERGEKTRGTEDVAATAEAKPSELEANTKPTPAAPDKISAKPSRGLFSWKKREDREAPDAASGRNSEKAKSPQAEAKAPSPGAADARPTPASVAKAAAKPSRRLFSWRQPEAEKEPETVTAAATPKVEPPQPPTPVEEPPKPDRATRKKFKRAKSKPTEAATKPAPGADRSQTKPSNVAVAAKPDMAGPSASDPQEAAAAKDVKQPPADAAAVSNEPAEIAPPERPAASAKVRDTAPSSAPKIETPPPQTPEPAHTEPLLRREPFAEAATALAFGPDELAVEAEPDKRPSFFKRLFMRKPKPAETGIDAQIIERLAAAYAEQAEAAPGAVSDEPAPVTIAPRLMEKLSSLGGDEIPPDEAEEESVEDDLDDVEDVLAAADAAGESLPDDEETDEPDLTEPGPLTLSILELQSKMKPKTPQIRSFPWLRE